VDAHRIGRGLTGISRPAALVLVTIVYVAAGLAGWAVAAALDAWDPIPRTLAADVAATLVVFAAAQLVRNASMYDPYWSVAPPVIVAAWAASEPGDGARSAIVVALVAIWGVRLTANWATGWRGLGHEDWRYRKLRDDTRGRLPFWVVNLLGIELMPTLLVFAGLLAAWPAVAEGGSGLGALDVAAIVVTAAAIAIEAIADLQLRAFRRDPANAGRIADRGLWAWSRHPNYLGQIGFWWGLWLFGLAADPGWWWTVAGPLAIVALFAFVSVPMMDARSLERRPGYAEHMREVGALMPRRRSRGRRTSGGR
jgi:steroid 5-alpha reductase family enzyme